jgi:hypothetical protein
MDEDDIDDDILEVHSMANLQHAPGYQPRPSAQSVFPDPAHSGSGRISTADLLVLKEKFPQLGDFSMDFLQSRTMDELLRIASTSLRIKDAERARETEDRLAANKSALHSKFYNVAAGRDNRWTELHPARFLPGAAATAPTQYIKAREVNGLSSPPPLGCYDMTSVGMGGFVTSKGWLELGTYGSTKMKIEYFNINNAARSSNKKSDEEDTVLMKDVAEFSLALRTLRSAAQFATPWNYSYLALENFLHENEFCKVDLKNDENPARTLCQFSNFILGENANHWRDNTSFLTTAELSGYWKSFIGARPQGRASSSAESSQPKPPTQQQKPKEKKRKFPFVDICGKWNSGNCNKAPGSCYNFRGILLRHCCNWRDPSQPNSQPCGAAHQRVGNH